MQTVLLSKPVFRQKRIFIIRRLRHHPSGETSSTACPPPRLPARCLRGPAATQTCVQTCVQTRAYTCVQTHVHTHDHTRAHTHVDTEHVRTRVHTCVHAHDPTDVPRCAHAHVHGGGMNGHAQDVKWASSCSITEMWHVMWHMVWAMVHTGYGLWHRLGPLHSLRLRSSSDRPVSSLSSFVCTVLKTFDINCVNQYMNCMSRAERRSVSHA